MPPRALAGAVATRLFAAEGMQVALADVQAKAGKQVAEQIVADGGMAVFLPCDVSREEQVQAAIDQAEAHFGGLQIVVNCAGVVQVGSLHELDAGQWDHLMGVNVKSVFFSLKHAWPHLGANSRSYMVNIGSISSFVGQAATPAYTASKYAVLGLSRSTRWIMPPPACAATASVPASPTRRCCANTSTRRATPRRRWPNGCGACRWVRFSSRRKSPARCCIWRARIRAGRDRDIADR